MIDDKLIIEFILTPTDGEFVLFRLGILKTVKLFISRPILDADWPNFGKQGKLLDVKIFR